MLVRFLVLCCICISLDKREGTYQLLHLFVVLRFFKLELLRGLPFRYSHSLAFIRFSDRIGSASGTAASSGAGSRVRSGCSSLGGASSVVLQFEFVQAQQTKRLVSWNLHTHAKGRSIRQAHIDRAR